MGVGGIDDESVKGLLVGEGRGYGHGGIEGQRVEGKMLLDLNGTTDVGDKSGELGVEG